MFIRISRRSRRAFTLVEMLVSVGVFSVGALVLASVFIFSLRSFAALANYGILDIENRQAMDIITREIRQAQYVSSYTPNPPTLTLLNGSGQTVVYSFSSAQQKMIRSVNGSSEILLTNCSLINFNLFQRNPSNGTFNIYVSSTNWQSEVKVVELTWKTARAMGGLARANSENVQTARIVIRK